MIFHARSSKRPFHLGRFPLEALPRDPGLRTSECARPKQPAAAIGSPATQSTLAGIAQQYCDIYAQFAAGKVAVREAPVPADIERRSDEIKGFAYFMDAAQVGICRLPNNAWLEGSTASQASHAVVVLVEFPRIPEADNLACDWVSGADQALAQLRANEISALLAGHIRHLGWNAVADIEAARQLDVDRLAVLSGLAIRGPRGLLNPFIDHFALSVVTTDYALAVDDPLHEKAMRTSKLRYWWGRNGAQSGRERQRRRKRASHLSHYPMEQVGRSARPTTLIIDDEVPRLPKRAAFFERALKGDLGKKAQRERGNFSFKHPTSRSLLAVIRALVPFQDGEVNQQQSKLCSNAEKNAKAVKALSYALGADLTGICEIPDYAWNSHQVDGTPIQPYHRYAVVMLIDQGYETMEGASGDDWISGTQSMRGYLRGAEIAGVMASLIRDLGFSARSQTNADSDVMHIPLLLLAGLGELSRIGELVLNPFVGPRFKSVVLTTELPLAVDQPIDFGLQYFCENCSKCARECPCDAISWGDKVMFNGYEMWKPDVERCTKYRLTNMRGSACGRCMKTCPLNKIVDRDGALIIRLANWLGLHARWLQPLLVPLATRLDDWVGHGRRNLSKKWWFDLELVDDVAVTPKATNERELKRHQPGSSAKQKIAYYHANQMPPPDQVVPLPLDRQQALAAAALVESPAAARERLARGEARPLHYYPTPPRRAADDETLQARDERMPGTSE